MSEGPKPTVGEVVHYYDPSIIKKIGRSEGYAGRGAGPYAAIVSNETKAGLEIFVLFPETEPFTIRAVPFKPEVDSDKHYWDFTNGAQKARAVKRAVKRASDAEAAKKAEA